MGIVPLSTRILSNSSHDSFFLPTVRRNDVETVLTRMSVLINEIEPRDVSSSGNEEVEGF